MKKLMLFLALVLISSLSSAQTIQYKNELSDDWQTLDVSKIEPSCLSTAKALKLSGDFSNFKVSLKKSDGNYGEYFTGLVINSCLNGYPDLILRYYWCFNNSLQELDMSEVTGLNALDAFLMCCDKLTKISFPKATISNTITMDAAFWDCYSLEEIDLSMFTNLDDIKQSFVNCRSLTKIKFCSNPEKKELSNIIYAFKGCESLKAIDLSMFSVNTTYLFSREVFVDCHSLNYVYLPTDFVKSSYENNVLQNFSGANPNCVKILSTEETVPENMYNTICNRKALTDFVLKEGSTTSTATNTVYHYGFETPVPIRLDGKTATFTPLVAAYGNGVGGWNTITLPFTGALQVKGDTDDDYKTVYPATSSFQGYYWLRGYKDGTGKAVNFGIVNDVNTATGEALQANTPYIIALPGSNFGDDSMDGKQVRFIATSDVIPTTTSLRVEGESGNYAFQGNLNGNPVSGTAYKLVNQDNGRDYFEQTTDANLPFHAQIIATSEAASTAKRLSIAYGGTTGIVGVKDETSREPATYFTIGGANTGVTDASRLNKGVYIRGNKKIIIK